MLEDDGSWNGFDVDYCRALAAAIFLDTSPLAVTTADIDGYIEFTSWPASQRFLALSNGTVDVLSRLTTHTIGRDVYEPTAGTGFSFSVPNFYDGLGFGGVPEVRTVRTAARILRPCLTPRNSMEPFAPHTHRLANSLCVAALAALISSACSFPTDHSSVCAAQFAACADNLDVSGPCAALRICVNDGTTTLAGVSALFPMEVCGQLLTIS